MSRINIQSSRGTIDLRPVMGRMGPQGVQGIQGIQGIQGPIGIAGAVGNTGPAGIPGVNGVENAAAVAAYLRTPGNDTYDAGRELMADRAPALGFPRVYDITTVTLAAAPTTVRPTEYFDGYLWGTQGSQLMRSSDEGVTWGAIGSVPPGLFIRFSKTASGEIIGHTGSRIYKSSGWAANPATATWSVKGPVPNGTAVFPRGGWTGDGTKFGIVEYGNNTDSRYAHISTDQGETWTTIWDADTRFPGTPPADSHVHAIEYDRWRDRWWLTEGHGADRGIYYSDDDGATWTRVTGGAANAMSPTPTCMVATKRGIVFGSDSATFSVYSLIEDQAQLSVQGILRWSSPADGVVGFGVRGWYDETTDSAIIGYYTAYTNIKPIVVAATVDAAEVIWEAPELSGLSAQVFAAFALPGKRFLAQHQDASQNLSVSTGKWGYGPRTAPADWDTGGVRTGLVPTAFKGTSLAAGAGATVNSSPDSVALGVGASAAPIDTTNGKGTAVGRSSMAESLGTAVGYLAKANNNCVAIGRLADTNGVVGSTAVGTTSTIIGTEGAAFGSRSKAASASVALGTGAEAGTAAGVGCVSVGYAALTNSGQAYGTAVGRSANAGHLNTTAIGRAASASGVNSTALGESVTASGFGAVAIGKDSSYTSATATTTDEFSLGTAKHNVIVRGYFQVAASSATKNSFIVPHGTAPTTPTNGNIWTTTAGMFVQINGVTKTVTLT